MKSIVFTILLSAVLVSVAFGHPTADAVEITESGSDSAVSLSDLASAKDVTEFDIDNDKEFVIDTADRTYKKRCYRYDTKCKKKCYPHQVKKCIRYKYGKCYKYAYHTQRKCKRFCYKYCASRRGHGRHH